MQLQTHSMKKDARSREWNHSKFGELQEVGCKQEEVV